MRNGDGLPAPVISETGGDDFLMRAGHRGSALVGNGKPKALGDFHFALLGQAQERNHRVGDLGRGAHGRNGGIGGINGKRGVAAESRKVTRNDAVVPLRIQGKEKPRRASDGAWGE